MTPAQYIKAKRNEGKFPNMLIDCIAGGYYLCDGDWNLLKGKSYKSNDEAMKARSKFLDRNVK